MTDYKQFIRKRIRELRKQTGVSAKKMSYELGFSHAYISNILSGKKMPSLERLVAIVEYFDISMSDFFDEHNNSPKTSGPLYTQIKSVSESDQKILMYIADLMQNQHE